MTFISKQGNVCIYVKCRRDDLMERSYISINALSQFLLCLLNPVSSIVPSKNDRNWNVQSELCVAPCIAI